MSLLQNTINFEDKRLKGQGAGQSHLGTYTVSVSLWYMW